MPLDSRPANGAPGVRAASLEGMENLGPVILMNNLLGDNRHHLTPFAELKLGCPLA